MKKVFPFLILAIICLLLVQQWFKLTEITGQVDTMFYGWEVSISEGSQPYPVSENFNTGSMVYTPVKFLLVGNLMKVFGQSPMVGQVVNFVSMIGVLVTLYLISYHLLKDFLWSFLPVVLMGMNPVFQGSGRDLGCDMPALLFFLVGVYLVVLGKYWWSIIPFCLAFFTYQLFIVGPLAVGIYLFTKWGWMYLLAFSLVLGVGFLIGNRYTDGMMFKSVFLFPIQNSQEQYYSYELGGWRHIFRMYAQLVVYSGIPLVLGMIAFVKSRKWSFFNIALVVAWILVLATMWKRGSGLYYSFQLVSISAVMGTVWFKIYLERKFNASRITT